MKKVYTRPSFKTVEIKTRQVLMTSFDKNLNGDGKDGSQALSRDGFFDEDEEEEEY